MPIVPVSQPIRTGFIRLCAEARIADPLRTTKTQNGVEVPILHLDRLWATPSLLSGIFALSVAALRESGLLESHHIDTIVPITSSLASFGPIPLSGLLAKEFGLRLVIAHEIPLGEFTPYPLDLRGRHADGGKALLLKDGIVRGASISRVARLLDALGIGLAAILVFVDLDNPTQTAASILREKPTITFLLGSELNELRMN